VRVAAEARDDVEMLLRPRQRLGEPFGRQLAEQAQRFVLVGHLLGVLERQVGEPALERRQLQVAAVGDQLPGDRQRRGIAGERTRAVAVHVARELVEQQDQRQRAARVAVGPVRQLAAQRRFDRGAEAVADQAVGGRRLAEPEPD